MVDMAGGTFTMPIIPFTFVGVCVGGTDAVCNSVNGGSMFGAPIIGPPQTKLGVQAVNGRLLCRWANCRSSGHSCRPDVRPSLMDGRKAVIFLGPSIHIVIMNGFHVRLRIVHAKEYMEDPQRVLVAP